MTNLVGLLPGKQAYMRMAGIDFETTGLSPEKDVVTEVGLVIWDFDLHTPVEMLSCFVDWGLKEMDPVVTGITGITMDMLSEFGQSPDEVFNAINTLATKSKSVAFAAHNGEAFDRLFYNAWGPRVEMDCLSMDWVDSQNDVPYPDEIKTRKLTHLAAEHDFLNPFAHRAVFDVLTMFRIMEKYDVKEILKLSKEPVIYLRAKVEYAQRQLASARGYRWNPDLKVWYRSFKESQVKKEIAECGFQVIQINKPPDEKR